MRGRVFFTTAEVDAAFTEDQTAVVVDVLRATSTIVSALAAGAKAIYPVVETDEAIRLASSLGREDTLLCGERKGLKVPGFDLGNSPLEFTKERVGGMRLVMSTTNGTRALHAAAGAGRVIAASLLNLEAVQNALEGTDDLAIVCAGRGGRLALEDAVCAGLILEKVLEGADEPSLDDGARAALAMARSFSSDASFLATVQGGQALVDIGLKADVEHCARRDLHTIVPEMQERMIRAADGS